MDRLHTVKETLSILSISRTKLYDLIGSGKIKPVKLDKRTLFPESEINRFLDNLKNTER